MNVSRALPLLAATLLAALPTAPAAAQEVERVWLRPAMAGGWIGISFEPGRLPEGAQRPVVVITRVVEDSPAERAGIEAGDTLLSVNGLAASQELIGSLAASLSPGDEVDLLVRRAGQQRRVTLEAGERPAEYVALSPSMGIVSFDTDSIMGRVRILMDSAASGVAIRRLPEVMVERLPYLVDTLRMHLDTLDMSRFGFSRDSVPFRLQMRLVGPDSAMRVFSADSMVRRFEGMLRYQRDSLFSDTARFRPFSRGRLSEQDSALQRLFSRGAVTSYDSAWSVPDFRARQVEGAAPSVWRFYGNSAAVAGAPLQEVGRQLADALDLGADEGLLVLEVPDGTPARRADLRTGDLIVAAGGQSVGTMAELRRAIDRAPRGEPLLLEVLRKRQRVRLTLPRD